MRAVHSSLANTAANDDLVAKVAEGYAKCRANLAWLKRSNANSITWTASQKAPPVKDITNQMPLIAGGTLGAKTTIYQEKRQQRHVKGSRKSA
jgi:hypothetical protein